MMITIGKTIESTKYIVIHKSKNFEYSIMDWLVLLIGDLYENW